MIIDNHITPEELKQKLARFWDLSGEKILRIEKSYPTDAGAPVYTIGGNYSPRGWTDWTQGFRYGSALLQFDATGEEIFLKTGRDGTVWKMATHVSHTGVHDHGFNNISTYGNLLRMVKEGTLPEQEWEVNFYELALKVSGAVQAGRWTRISGGGFIYSFNGPHSLFVDTLRSCRILMVAHLLGHYLQGENDIRISLMSRAIDHLKATARFSVYYGEGRDLYDEWGRTAHESLFNPIDGNYRCPGTQQGYSVFSTWTRGLAWAMLGFAEEIELFSTIPDDFFSTLNEKEEIMQLMMKAARATCDFYIAHTPSDGIPYWDTAAPGLAGLKDYLLRPADPFNDFEPVDSSAAAIAMQGLLRLGHHLLSRVETSEASRYWQAGLTIASQLFDDPYLSVDPRHQGILLHSLYHRPNKWDPVPEGYKVPCNESTMWGDYHIRENALYLDRIIQKKKYLTFFNCVI